MEDRIMARNVVTSCAQLGSGGHEVAQEVAHGLGLRFYDREVIWRAAELSGVSPEAIAGAERWPSLIERMMESLTTSAVVTDGYFMSPIAGNGLTMRSSADYRALIEEVVRGLADEGNCVIVGHAGQAVLRNAPGVFKVLVHGAREARARRVARSEALALDAATQLVADDDCRRAKFFKCAYGMDWLGSGAYDLTINGSEIDTATAANWVVAGLKAGDRQLAPA
jgi:cytidylate kinase